MLNYGYLVFYSSRTSDLHLLSQFDLLQSFPQAGASLEKAAFSYYMAELTASAGYGVEQSRYLFKLLIHVLRKAQAITSLPYVQLWFEIRFLHGLGVFPSADHCSRCGGKPGNCVWFSPREEGWLCATCRRSDTRAVPLAPGLREAIGRLLSDGLERGQKLKLSAPQAKALQSVVRYLIDSQLGKELKSRCFLQHVSSPKENDGFSDAYPEIK